MRTRIFLRFVLVVLPVIGLMLLWLSFLPRQGQTVPVAAAEAAVEDSSTPAPVPAATPDPRWLEIVHARSSGQAAPLAQTLSINLNLTDGYAAGRVPSAAQVDITITHQGEVIAQTSVMPMFDGNGFFYLAYPYEGNLQPDFGVWVAQGGAVISMTIPTLTVLAYPQTDALSGAAPANAALTGYLFPYANPGQVYTATASASAEGAYQMIWSPSVDLRPLDRGYLLYAQDAVRQTYMRFVAPFLRLQVGGSDLFGAAAPNHAVEIVVEDNTGAALYNFGAYTDSDGFFYAGSCDGFYSVNTFSPSTRVIAVAGGQTFSMTVITLTARADLQAGQVWGQALAGQPVEVLRFGGPLGVGGNCIFQGQPLNRVIVTATVSGGYAAPLPLAAGNYGAALVTLPGGDQVYTRFAAPYMHVTLGKPFDYPYSDYWQGMWGQVEEPFTPITVEIQGPSGYLKDWYIRMSQENGYFYDGYTYENDLSLEGGDHITLTTPQGPQVSLLLPVLTAAAHPNTDIVSGQAPPFSQVVVTVYDNMTLTVTADAEGQYRADFSGLGGFGNYAVGEAAWTNLDGYTVVRIFIADPWYDCPPSLASAQIGGNAVSIDGGGTCGPFAFRLHGADGQIKYENNSGIPSPYALYDENGRPVIISIGDQFEIVTGDQVEISVVPTFTAHLDPQTDQVYGQAPPSAVIELRTGYWAVPVLTTTANAQGDYTFDLAGVTDLDAGSSLRAALNGKPNYFTYGLLPVLNAELYSPMVKGRLPPFTPYTITLSSPLTVTDLITGSADETGYFEGNMYPPPGEEPISQPGDRLEMKTPTRLWEMILPWLTADLDASTGVVSGQAPPASSVKIDLFVGYEDNYSTIVTATASGTYSATFPVPDEAVYISGRVTQFTADDLRTSLQFTTPCWHVTLGSEMVSGSAPVYSGPITFTLQSSDGAFSQVITMDFIQYSFLLNFQRAIQPGDRLTMQTGDGLVSEFTVPVLTATHNFTRSVLEGQAPVDGNITADIPIYEFDRSMLAHRHVRVAPNGHYGVDTSDLNLLVGWQGYIQYTDRLWNTVVCPFTIRGYLLYLPLLQQFDLFP